MKDKSDGESDKNVRYKNKIVEIYGNLKQEGKNKPINVTLQSAFKVVLFM